MATTEMLCHLDVSRSSAFSVVMVPFVESMLNSRSRSVCRSMEYLEGRCEGFISFITIVFPHKLETGVRRCSAAALREPGVA